MVTCSKVLIQVKISATLTWFREFYPLIKKKMFCLNIALVRAYRLNLSTWDKNNSSNKVLEENILAIRLTTLSYIRDHNYILGIWTTNYRCRFLSSLLNSSSSILMKPKIRYHCFNKTCSESRRHARHDYIAHLVFFSQIW